ncbi:hypothetical protein SS50377_22274 [Spironucleus salmonicida]|uniref:Uncharacterized protein n=1 Tax=Spironucleus salmonicida TaxID=348837 RepID=V6LCQ5_9EUKA|nr:hypothetical protein SS50377_22274 [Spironucleus salmonicida]|eukprot:EST42232.1 Hypothetical protein SS50377_18534 [Spironucleus salmonicida]
MEQSLESNILKDIELTQQIIKNSQLHIDQPLIQLNLLKYDQQQRESRIKILQNEVQTLRFQLKQYPTYTLQNANVQASENELEIQEISRQIDLLINSILDKIDRVKSCL